VSFLKRRAEPVFGHATCIRCKQMVTVPTTGPPWHSHSGCVSCDAVADADGFYSEPVDAWTGRRASV
jgi:hypothetical protein